MRQGNGIGKSFSEKDEVIRFMDMDIQVIRKPIKHMYIRIVPPYGKIRVSIPRNTSVHSLKAMLVKKRAWIEKASARVRERVYQPKKVFQDGATHSFLGKQLQIAVSCSEIPRHQRGNGIYYSGDRVTLLFRSEPAESQVQARLESWYRQELRRLVGVLLPKWETRMGVHVDIWKIRKMRSRWGSCRPASRSITLNFFLILYPASCIEFILVHEMVHLLEPYHNKHFYALMELHLPDWKEHDRHLRQHQLIPQH